MALSPAPDHAAGHLSALTLRDKYHIQRAVGLVCEGEERHTLARYLGIRDDEHLCERALTVALNHLDMLVALLERLTGHGEGGVLTVPGDGK